MLEQDLNLIRMKTIYLKKRHNFIFVAFIILVLMLLFQIYFGYKHNFAFWFDFDQDIKSTRYIDDNYLSEYFDFEDIDEIENSELWNDIQLIMT